MFRFFRPLRRLVPSWRFAARSTGRQIVHVERVKITKARHATRFIGPVIGGAVVINLLFFNPEWHIEWSDEEENNEGQEEEEEEDDGEYFKEGDWFIPFPLTLEVVPPEPYSVNSPEWQAFVKVSRNPNEQRRVKRLAAETARDRLAATHWAKSRFGEIRGVTDFWLDIDYPYKAPPEYWRSGILITDDMILWANVQCDSTLAKKLRQTLWPTPVALGFWALGKEAVKETANEWARYLGFASENPPSVGRGTSINPAAPVPDPRGSDVQKAIEGVRQQATRHPEAVKDPGSMSPSTAGSPGGSSSSSPNKALSVPGKPAVERTGQDVVQPTSYPKPILKAVKAYRDAWQPVRPDPERGCFLVSGLVRLETARGYLTLTAAFWYNPHTRAFDMASSKLSFYKWHPLPQRAARP